MIETTTLRSAPPIRNPYSPRREPSRIAIRPLGTPFGAEVTGIDWDLGSEGIVEELTRAMRRICC